MRDTTETPPAAGPKPVHQAKEDRAPRRPAPASWLHHPESHPLDYRLAPPPRRAHRARGGLGLRFYGWKAPRTGAWLEIRIPVGGEVHRFRARVRKIVPRGGRCRIDVWIGGPEDAFRARMAEQLCRIELYRRRLSNRRGTSVGDDDAARAWIENFAAAFPALC